MSGRKQKTERKKTKQEKAQEPQVFFEDGLLAFLRNVGQAVGGIKNRPDGAQNLGPEAMFVCTTEALGLARNSGDAKGYISASAYALVAAMLQAGAWTLPPRPMPEPVEEEGPKEPPKKGSKKAPEKEAAK
ncbi:hypothetical protein LCGC14_2557050 [marine sediment metagenome]|uniref:Uncharacterized protein n=1 Tax=marine sediment metagenome TaxID=412755 RepID=A0A0F9AL60_9ZZZZ